MHVAVCAGTGALEEVTAPEAKAMIGIMTKTAAKRNLRITKLLVVLGILNTQHAIGNFHRTHVF